MCTEDSFRHTRSLMAFAALQFVTGPQSEADLAANWKQNTRSRPRRESALEYPARRQCSGRSRFVPRRMTADRELAAILFT
jgi:hypothetical protein